jgi:hypothetical protein
MLRVGELTERGMLTASIRPRNALRLKGLIPLLFGLARDCRRCRSGIGGKRLRRPG